MTSTEYTSTERSHRYIIDNFKGSHMSEYGSHRACLFETKKWLVFNLTREAINTMSLTQDGKDSFNTSCYLVNFHKVTSEESSHWHEIRCSCEGEMKTGPGRKRERQKVTENRAELTWKKKRRKRRRRRRSCRYSRDQSQKKRRC